MRLPQNWIIGEMNSILTPPLEPTRQTDHLLTEARAMVVRDYLVKNFKLEDTRIKTIGLGKSDKAEGGCIEVLIYPEGTTTAQSLNPPPSSQ